jgi:YidC/Oxa1 family membrane protein insertase
MDFLWPIKWVIELILVSFHTLFTWMGMGPADGITWVLAITGLVVVVRAAMIPLFVRQIVSQRNMLVVQPELQKLQKKYKGKTDPDSRQAFAKEQMDLYKKYSANPLSSCLPLLVQMPIFFSLFSVLSNSQKGLAGVGWLSKDLAVAFADSSVFGAHLKDTFMTPGASVTVKVLAATMIVLMTASQFITQRQILAKNQNPAAMTSQYAQTQKIMLYVFPIIFAISGVAFPLGVMTYWLVSNFWTMAQQFVVIRNMPTPGSEAHKAREARLAKKGKVSTPAAIVATEGTEAADEPVKTQRAQPVSKTRAKKNVK